MLAAGLAIAVGSTIIIKQLQSVQQVGNRIRITNNNIELIRQSLVDFAKIKGRLPCPANASSVADTGISAPAVASICTNANPQGIVPWVTLGIPQGTSLDGWSRKISYSVYQGTLGFTQNLAVGQGFTVKDKGSNIAQVAFVLISHGESGNGAWITGGGRITLPPAGNQEEFRNTQAGTTYFNKLYTDPTVIPTDINHFDDVVVYMSISDLISQADR